MRAGVERDGIFARVEAIVGRIKTTHFESRGTTPEIYPA
jgi:hypothetical protein